LKDILGRIEKVEEAKSFRSTITQEKGFVWNKDCKTRRISDLLDE
jgi:hypothetical protein